MELRNLIEDKYKQSIKSQKTEDVNTLRLIRSAIKDKDIEKRSIGNSDVITDNEIIALLQNLIKQRKESIESFKLASRDDLVSKELYEIEIISQFLPQQLTSDEIKNIINLFIKENNLSSIKEMGKIMGFLKKNYAATIDMNAAGKIAKEILNN